MVFKRLCIICYLCDQYALLSVCICKICEQIRHTGLEFLQKYQEQKVFAKFDSRCGWVRLKMLIDHQNSKGGGLDGEANAPSFYRWGQKQEREEGT